jgi:hypothetical protein
MNSKEYHRNYYLEHKDKYIPDPVKKRVNDLKYQEKNRDKINSARRQWRWDNYEKEMYMQVRKRCVADSIPFNLELDDIQIPECCPYLLFPLTRIGGQGRVWTNPSLDRIDPTKGYTKGNVEVISMRANAMKQAATKEELLTFSNSVIEKFGGT